MGYQRVVKNVLSLALALRRKLHWPRVSVPGRQVANTFSVGGDPQFVITGLYPPVLGTTPQQATIYGTILNIAAYIFVVALFIVPIILFRRYSKAAKKQ